MKEWIADSCYMERDKKIGKALLRRIKTGTKALFSSCGENMGIYLLWIYRQKGVSGLTEV